jgi:hypothetical protein
VSYFAVFGKLWIVMGGVGTALCELLGSLWQAVDCDGGGGGGIVLSACEWHARTATKVHRERGGGEGKSGDGKSSGNVWKIVHLTGSLKIDTVRVEVEQQRHHRLAHPGLLLLVGCVCQCE